MTQIVQDDKNSQFVLSIDNQIVYTKYRMHDDKTIEFYSTHTPKPLRGQGYAAKLVNHALDWAQAKNYEVIPTCWYVKKVFDQRNLEKN